MLQYRLVALRMSHSWGEPWELGCAWTRLQTPARLDAEQILFLDRTITASRSFKT
jgi:hypothetical protein